MSFIKILLNLVEYNTNPIFGETSPLIEPFYKKALFIMLN